MRNSDLNNIFQNIKNERRGGAPHESWLRQSREVLVMQVRNTMATDTEPKMSAKVRHLFDIFMPVEGMLMTARAMGVFMLVVGSVFGGGLASAQLYRDAVPGTLSYKMKIGIERTQLALAPNEDYRTRLHTEFADRRMDEVARLAEGSAVRQALVPQTLAAFRVEIAALSSGLESLRANDPATVVETAKLLERKMAVYQNQLRKSSAFLAPSLLPSIAATRDALDGVTIKSMAVIVEHHLAGDTEASAAVVVTKFEERIKVAETKLETNGNPKASEAKAAIAAAKVLIKEENYQAALLKITEVVELTKEEVAPEETVTPIEPVTTEGEPASTTKE